MFEALKEACKVFGLAMGQAHKAIAENKKFEICVSDEHNAKVIMDALFAEKSYFDFYWWGDTYYIAMYGKEVEEKEAARFGSGEGEDGTD